MRILLLDIETCPLTSFHWGLWDQNIAINQIVEDGRTICWAAKWLKEREIMFDSEHESNPNKMFKRIHKLVDEADAVIHYNGTQFDMPHLNTGFLDHDLVPPSHYANIDLLQTARRQFKFASNKLDYVARRLGLGSKLKHKGMDLWRGCMNGNESDWRTMKRYNIQDVRLLEKVYLKLLPWIPNHPNLGVCINAEKLTCGSCGSENVKRDGIQYNKTLSYQRYRCKGCGKPQRSPKRLSPRGEGVLV